MKVTSSSYWGRFYTKTLGSMLLSCAEYVLKQKKAPKQGTKTRKPTMFSFNASSCDDCYLNRERKRTAPPCALATALGPTILTLPIDNTRKAILLLLRWAIVFGLILSSTSFLCTPCLEFSHFLLASPSVSFSLPPILLPGWRAPPRTFQM